MYVEALIGTDTVVTMPPKTLDAFRDHGVVACTVNANMSEAERALESIERAGISMHDVTTKLLTDGIASFEASSAALLHRLKQKAAELDVALADVGLSHM